MSLPMHLEHWNQLAQIAYPFLDSQAPTYGGDPLPSGFVLDAWIAVLAADWEPYRLHAIVAADTAATFVFRGTVSGDEVQAVVSWTGDAPYVGRVATGDHVAGIVAGAAARSAFEGLSATYACANAVIEPARVIPAAGLRVRSMAAGVGDPVAGAVVLREGHGVRITSSPGARPTVRVSGVPGAGKGVPCADPEDGVGCADVLLWLNGLGADALGASELVGGFGVDIVAEPAAHRLTISLGMSEDQLQCEGC